MKKTLFLLAAVVLLAGCGKTEYVTRQYTDVQEGDFFESAVKFCVNEGFMFSEGEEFGISEPVTLSECADIVAKIVGENDSIKYVVKNGIAPADFGDWDIPATRENVAYMLSHALEHEYMNGVVDGAIEDVDESFAKDEIYTLYRMGIFSGDKDEVTFRPKEYMTRSEMAIVTERICDSAKRVKFDKSRLEVSFVAFGDTIGHLPAVKAGQVSDGYNFDEFFENVLTYINEADVACVNQETVFVESGFSGYPAFGTPEEFGVAEVNAGFDVVTHATNHAFDRGETGVLYTAEFWKSYDKVKMLGIHESEEDAAEICVIEKNGIKIALLNYTYSLNGYSLPKGKEYLVDLLDEDKIKWDMAKAREISDAVVVFAHWGNEYQNKADKTQKTWAQFFANQGATVIVGHHPHVVQPLEYVESFDGRRVPVYYSLGNFISNQNDYQTALCAMADFKIVKDENGVRCENALIEPVITHMQSGYYSAYLLKDYPEEMITKHKHRGKYGAKFSVEAYGELFDNITAG